MQITKQTMNNVKLISYSALLCLLSFYSIHLSPDNTQSYILIFLLFSVLHFVNIENPLLEKYLVIVLVISFFAKLVLVFSEAYFSNDIYRYFLDGNLTRNGINPYSLSPNAVISSQLLTDNPFYLNNINHKEFSSIYLLFPELIFFISAVFIYLKSLYLVIELSLLSFVYFKKRDAFLLLSLICLHPLYIVETYSSGHFDFIFLFLIFIYYEFNRNVIIKNSAYLLSVLTKGFSLFFLKINSKTALLFISAFSLLILNLFLIQSSAESGLSAYHESFSFNNPIYEFLNSYFQTSYHDIQELMPYQLFNKIITFIISILIAIIAFRRYKSEIYYLGLLFSFIFIFGSATIHPWYLLVLIYFSLKLDLKSLLFMTYTIFISYVVLIEFKGNNIWQLDDYFFWFIYSPFIIKLGIVLNHQLQKVYKICQQYVSKM